MFPSSSTTPPTINTPTAPAATTTTRAKRHLNLSTLTIPALKTLLRAGGLPVKGKKADLLTRLNYTNNDDDASPNALYLLRLIRSDSSSSHDPSTLIGHRIQGFETRVDAFILVTDRARVTITFDAHNANARYAAEIVADDALIEGLEPVQRGMREGLGPKGLLIEEAVALPVYPGSGECYRVVGLRCEGMKGFGFVFAVDSVLEDYEGSPEWSPVEETGEEMLDRGSGGGGL